MVTLAENLLAEKKVLEAKLKRSQELIQNAKNLMRQGVEFIERYEEKKNNESLLNNI